MKPRSFITTLITLAASVSLAQAAAYIKFDGVDGEAMHPDGSDGWIIIESMSSPIARSTGGGGAGGGVSAGDVVCVKELDKATPKLMEALCTGAVIPQLTVSLTRDVAGKEVEYYKVTMKNIVLTKNSLSLIRELDKSSTKAVEDVTLGYTEVEWTYIVLDESGEVQETIKRNFNFGDNQ